jgi:hypothetical protein
MKVTSTAKIVVKYTTTVEELTKMLANVPARAKVSVFKEPHYDQRDPGQAGLTFTWEEEL